MLLHYCHLQDVLRIAPASTAPPSKSSAETLNHEAENLSVEHRLLVVIRATSDSTTNREEAAPSNTPFLPRRLTVAASSGEVSLVNLRAP